MQLAFLSTMISPKVASAAAQRALEVLASEDVSTADHEDYLPMEEPTNGKSEAAAAAEPVAAAAAAAAAEVATPEPPAASEPASQAAPAEAVAKAEDARNEDLVKDELMHEHKDAADASTAAPRNGAPAHPLPLYEEFFS